MKFKTKMLDKKTHNSYSTKNKQPNHTLSLGRLGIKVLSFNQLTGTQIHSLKRNLLKLLKKLTNNKKITKLWFMKSLNMTITKLNSESRMGKGKGMIHDKTVFLRPGDIILEFEGISRQQVYRILCFLTTQISFRMIVVGK